MHTATCHEARVGWRAGQGIARGVALLTLQFLLQFFFIVFFVAVFVLGEPRVNWAALKVLFVALGNHSLGGIMARQLYKGILVWQGWFAMQLDKGHAVWIDFRVNKLGQLVFV